MRGALTLLLSAAIFLRPGAVLAKPRVLVVTGNLKIYLDTAKQLPRYFDAAYTQADTSQARAHLSQGKFEAVVAIGQEAAELAMAAEKQKPVFFALAVHIEKLNLRQPNAAGVDINASLATQLERIKKTLPRARRVGVLDNFAANPQKVGALQSVAAQKGLQAEPCSLATPREMPQCAQRLLMQHRVDVILAQPGAAYDHGGLDYLGKNAVNQKVPLVGYGLMFIQKYPFLHTLGPDAQGSAQDLANLLRDKLVLRKRLPPLSEPKYLVQYFNSTVGANLKVKTPGNNHVRVQKL